jgi:hypothetical protein
MQIRIAHGRGFKRCAMPRIPQRIVRIPAAGVNRQVTAAEVNQPSQRPVI